VTRIHLPSILSGIFFLHREDLLKPDVMSEVILLGAGISLRDPDSDPGRSSDSSLRADLKPKDPSKELHLSWRRIRFRP
jgi:hypothetical protein